MLLVALACNGAYGQSLLLGVTDNEWLDPWAVEQAQALDFDAIRVFVFRNDLLSEEVGSDDIRLVAAARSTGARVFVTITPEWLSALEEGTPPDTPARRKSFAAFAADLVRRTGVRDVIVWNEPNLGGWWGAAPNPAAYGRLLAATYDALKPLRARVWALGLERTELTRWFTRELGAWYRRSGRKRPLFHGVTHHPYPVAREDPFVSHPGTSTYTIGDTPRFIALLNHAFAETRQCRRKCDFPILYSEVGWPSAPMVWPSVGRAITLSYGEARQARILRQAVRWLKRYPRVIGFLNFELRDSRYWMTGLFTEAGRAKPAVRALFGRQPLPPPAEPTPAPPSPVPVETLLTPVLEDLTPPPPSDATAQPEASPPPGAIAPAPGTTPEPEASPEATTPSPHTPTLTTSASADVAVGEVVFDTATLAGGVDPTGTITFSLYGPDDADCSRPPVFTDTVTVAGNGQYASAGFTPILPGVYRWTASYSGDAENTPALSGCDAPGESVVVSEPSVPPPPPPE